MALLVAAGAGLGSLFDFEVMRAIADRLASDGNAATYDRVLHAANVICLRAIAIAMAAFGATLLAWGPAVVRALPCSSTGTYVETLPKPGRKPLLVWTVTFLTLLLSVRLWYLDHEGWDESTFIIMASHVLQGHLPYLELLDLKPPGLFLALAGVMSVFGENLLAVRLFGAFCLLVSAVAGYAIAVRRTTPLIAGVSMAVFCVLTSEIEFQQTLTEHLVLALSMPAVWLLVARRNRLWAAFVIGVLLSAATLTRMNIAYVVLAVGGFYVWRSVRPRRDVPRAAVVAYGLGGVLPLGSLVLIYWLAGGLDVFVVSVFWAPLHYATSQLGMTAALLDHIGYWMRCIREAAYIFVPATILVGAGLPAHGFNRGKAILRGDDGLLLLVLGATALSILRGGAAFGHYLLQVLPLVVLIAAAGFATLRKQPRGALFFLGLSILIVGAALGRFGDDSIRWVRNEVRAPERLTSLQRAANLIREDRCCGETVYAPSKHLVYWYLNQSPPSAVVHPTALTRDAIIAPLVEYGYVPQDEQQRVLEQEFDYIVMDSGHELTWFTPEHRQHLDAILREHFRPWKRSGELVIYKRQ